MALVCSSVFASLFSSLLSTLLSILFCSLCSLLSALLSSSSPCSLLGCAPDPALLSPARCGNRFLTGAAALTRLGLVGSPHLPCGNQLERERERERERKRGERKRGEKSTGLGQAGLGQAGLGQSGLEGAGLEGAGACGGVRCCIAYANLKMIPSRQKRYSACVPIVYSKTINAKLPIYSHPTRARPSQSVITS